MFQMNGTSKLYVNIFTGKGGIGANDSIKAILTGVEKHLSLSTSTRLQKITVVVFEQKIFDDYCNYFTERNKMVSVCIDVSFCGFSI